MEYRFLWFVSKCNNDFEANSTSLMSLWANIKFCPEPTGELYGWLLTTLVLVFKCIRNLYSFLLGACGPVDRVLAQDQKVWASIRSDGHV